jgi:hypothetical protein
MPKIGPVRDFRDYGFFLVPIRYQAPDRIGTLEKNLLMQGIHTPQWLPNNLGLPKQGRATNIGVPKKSACHIPAPDFYNEN